MMTGRRFFRRTIRRIARLFNRRDDESENVLPAAAQEPDDLPPLPTPKDSSSETPVDNPIIPQRLSYEPGKDFQDKADISDGKNRALALHSPAADTNMASTNDVESKLNIHDPLAYMDETGDYPTVFPAAIPTSAAPWDTTEPQPLRGNYQGLDFPEINASIPQGESPLGESPDYAQIILRRISWDERRYPQSMED